MPHHTGARSVPAGRFWFFGRARVQCAAWVIAVGCVISGCAKPVWYLAPDIPEKHARKEGKPIFYYFRAFDSTHHRNMLRNVLWNNRVEAELMDTINLDLECGFFDEQQDRYGIRKPQVCLLAAPDGTRLTPNYDLVPVPTVDEFLAWLQAAKAKMPSAPAEATAAHDSAAERPATPMQSAP